MTVLPAICFSLVDDGPSFFHKVSYVSWMAACLGIIFFFPVEYHIIEIGIDINMPEKCLAGQLHVKGEKEHTCFYKRIVFLLAEDTQ